MNHEYDFFTIDKAHLKNKKMFPFQLYIFNPIHHNYSLVLNGNRPMTSEINNFIHYLLEKGGKLAILKKQKKTFLIATENNEQDIPSLAKRELHELEKEQIMYQKLYEMHVAKNGVFAFQFEFNKATGQDDFSKIIEQAKIELMAFSVCRSPTVSLAIAIAKEILTNDNELSRQIAVAYFLAKTMNINDQDSLGDIVVSSAFMHMGYTQYSLNVTRKPYLNLFDEEKKQFQKHTILSNYLCKKSNFPFSDRVKKIILDHHERYNGNGYPQEKNGDSIEPLALLIGAVAHLFEYSNGKIDGSKRPIKSTLHAIKNKSFSPGLELDFSDRIIKSLENLINTDNVKNNAA